jgi:predicted TIM-barrel fold metal-dependent hydrolase
MDAMTAEIQRMAAKGCRAITMPELPYMQGLPSYQSDYWDPFFRSVSDEGVVVCLHIGMGLDAIDMGPDFSPDNYMVLATQVTVLAVQDLLWGPAFRKYPDLKVAFSEGGIGWIPFLLDRVDRHYVTQRWTRQDFGDKQPSEVFREHALACFISDPTTLKLAHEIGIDLIAFESDYPHSDSLWPDAPESLLAQCEQAGLSDEDTEKISWRNVARFCDYDPFAVVPREQATVAALRAQAPDVDTSVVSRREWRARYEANPTYQLAAT